MSYREESYHKPKEDYSQITTKGIDASHDSLEDLKNLWRKNHPRWYARHLL